MAATEAAITRFDPGQPSSHLTLELAQVLEAHDHHVDKADLRRNLLDLLDRQDGGR